MNTFLPYSEYEACAECLDRPRLGKQRVENLQIMRTILMNRPGWRNHPAVNMWRPFLSELLKYQIEICRVWTSKGYKDTCFQKTLELVNEHANRVNASAGRPAWLDDMEFIEHTRRYLIHKDQDHYGSIWPDLEPVRYPLWPVNRADGKYDLEIL